MRTFIAIDIGEVVAANLARLQGEIRELLGSGQLGIKWADPELIHLTLKFLGDVSEDQIPEISRITAQVAAEFRGFSLEVINVCSFGSPPAVVWAGIEESEFLCRLQLDLDNRLAGIGFELDEKRFVPHLTLCRVKNPAAGKRLKPFIEGFKDYSAGKNDVKSICVYKSELTNTGPQYTLLSRNELA